MTLAVSEQEGTFHYFSASFPYCGLYNNSFCTAALMRVLLEEFKKMSSGTTPSVSGPNWKVPQQCMEVEKGITIDGH